MGAEGAPQTTNDAAVRPVYRTDSDDPVADSPVRRLPKHAWHNGQGTTREIMREDNASGSRFRWRLSMADITCDAPFSAYGGYQRILSLLEGPGLRLTIDGSAQPRCAAMVSCASLAIVGSAANCVMARCAIST